MRTSRPGCARAAAGRARSRWRGGSSVNEITMRGARHESRRLGLRSVGREDLLDPKLEEFRDGERQRETGVVLTRLDGVNRLPRDPQLDGQIVLGPAL